MKVVFEKETYRLLGAQIVGYEGVDKRIDVLATAIHAGKNNGDNLPFTSARDIGNMAAGYIAGLICRDSGNGSMGKMVQLLGNAGILYLSIPVVRMFLDLLQEILGEL